MLMMTSFIISLDIVHLNTYSSFTLSRCASPLEVKGDIACPLDRTLLPVAVCFEAISASNRYGAFQHLDHHLSITNMITPFFISRLDVGRVVHISACLPWGLPTIVAVITPQMHDYDSLTSSRKEDLSHHPSPSPTSFFQLQVSEHPISTMSSETNDDDTEGESFVSRILSKASEEPDDFISHFIETQASNFKSSKQKEAVLAMLLALEVKDIEDLADIEPGSLMMAFNDNGDITMLMVTRASRFFTANLHINFPGVSVKVEASPKPIPPRKSRKSGLLQPGDFLVQDSSAGVQSDPSTPIRYVGGVSSRQQASDDYAASGGGFGGLGKGASIRDSRQISSQNGYQCPSCPSSLGWFRGGLVFLLQEVYPPYEEGRIRDRVSTGFCRHCQIFELDS
jgi:hypothetical protein